MECAWNVCGNVCGYVWVRTLCLLMPLSRCSLVSVAVALLQFFRRSAIVKYHASVFVPHDGEGGSVCTPLCSVICYSISKSYRLTVVPHRGFAISEFAKSVEKPLGSALLLDGERFPSDATWRGFGMTPWGFARSRHASWLQSAFEH